MKHKENERPNLYKVMHKYIRVQISDIVALAGNTDFANEAERMLFDVGFKAFMKLLDDHAMREEKYFHPLLEQCENKELRLVEEEHKSLEKQLTHLKLSLKNSVDEKTSYQFYLDLTKFQAHYLSHLISEERHLLLELHKHCSDAQLNAANSALLADMPKEDMVNITKGMLPTMNHSERVEMFKSMKAGMPPSVFEFFLNLAAEALQPAQYEKLSLVVAS